MKGHYYIEARTAKWQEKVICQQLADSEDEAVAAVRAEGLSVEYVRCLRQPSLL